MARFASVSAEQIDKIIEDKDSENTKKSTKLAKHVFFEYLRGGGGVETWGGS